MTVSKYIRLKLALGDKTWCNSSMGDCYPMFMYFWNFIIGSIFFKLKAGSRQFKTSALVAALLLSFQLNAQKSSPDSLQLAFGNVSLAASDPSGNTWLVCGEHADSIIVVKQKKVIDVSQRIHLPSNIQFTCILPIDPHTVLLGTTSDYVYLLRNRRFVRLDESYGLTDSSIVSMRLDRDNQFLFVETSHKKYVLHNGSTKADFRFLEVTETNALVAKETDILRRYFRKPLQKAICDVFSDIDLSFRNQKYLGNKEFEKIRSLLNPGDILIKRNDRQVSNFGISGFWTHSAIYLGSLDDMNRYFDGLPMLNGQQASEFIRENYFEAYQQIFEQKQMIIEAIGKGVVISPLEHIAKVDYFAGFRPNLPREEIFRSILTAFSYYGSPYDFLFEFDSDDALVCSELIYKSFSETPDKNGLTFIGSSFEGHFFFYPNDIARQYCLEYESEKPALNLIIFYDGEEKENVEVPGEFCITLQRHSLF
ncbi:MAG: hypothetical protein IPH88_03685 [Bacteroidales bacterium]|nr:hypothetical protein [Bacteroidales bacterium]